MHYNDGESDIDDKRFFLSPSGNTNPKAELEATIDALLNETRFDDNSTACRFPARKAYLEKELNIKNLPVVTCNEFDTVMQRLDPTSTTLVFPSAHINSPASMFGHTLLRINSSFESKLLSYAVNYAADADPKKENGVIFALKGLFGGYFGNYSLLPYYEKLKEYRDGESRDVWEYDLNLSKEETLRMFRHIWEVNSTKSYYYFFTKNCSYNILWFIESARPSIHLREHFTFHVIPLETVHAAKLENIITKKYYRPSKRTKLLKYEKLLSPNNLKKPRKIVEGELSIDSVLNNKKISLSQKQYIFEASVEFLEYSYKRNKMTKQEYLELFNRLSSARATLGINETLEFSTPPNPINSHRALRIITGIGQKEDIQLAYLGLRFAYHDLEDSTYGFLRGTQIEFLNLQFSYDEENKFELEDATIVSIVSLAQRSEFFDNISWRTKFGFDRNIYIDDKTNFLATIGAGFSWGNELGYIYIMADPFAYLHKNIKSGIGSSLGLIIDKSKKFGTNIEFTSRIYENSNTQSLFNFSQNFRISQNIEFKLKYNYIERELETIKCDEQTIRGTLNFYF